MKRWIALLLALAMVLGLTACKKEEVEVLVGVAIPILCAVLEEGEQPPEEPLPPPPPEAEPIVEDTFTLAMVPAFTGQAYVPVNDNRPFFDPTGVPAESFEYYAPLDELGRCGITAACIGQDIMPTEDRGEIGYVKPSGWQSVKYPNVDGRYLYNRCHLIGFQLAGENANKGNLITGTRFLNIEGMLPFENMVADYVKETGNHVLYRVTPIFFGTELVARGVLMEGWSVEDQGESICFCVFAYNEQPGIIINYATGESWQLPEESPSKE